MPAADICSPDCGIVQVYQFPVQTQKGYMSIILIVEDDPVLLKMYSEKFTFEGFNVLNARDGEEALTVATTNDLQVILLDIMLPRMSGTDFLEKFRQSPKGKDTPVIALTNLAEEEEKQRVVKRKAAIRKSK